MNFVVNLLDFMYPGISPHEFELFFSYTVPVNYLKNNSLRALW